jgi:hypothetical protein
MGNLQKCMDDQQVYGLPRGCTDGSVRGTCVAEHNWYDNEVVGRCIAMMTMVDYMTTTVVVWMYDCAVVR